MQDAKRQLQILQYGTTEITPLDEFQKMLANSLDKNQPLRVKCGIDPTRADVHVGHLVPYRKMRAFQDLGHQGVVIIGDYTASIGDPTGKNEARPPLSSDEIKKNAERYMEQIFTVLDPKKTEVRYQSEWFSKVGLSDIISWAAQTTVAKLISHDTFKQRLENNLPLSLHEMFYPVLQGIDSVYVNADVELGGSDQKFNVLMGRDYQKARGKRPQIAMLLPIILGIDGVQKMSKSLGNYIGILDVAFDKFGKVMSIPDKLMPEYYQYVANSTQEEVEKIKQLLASGELHPNEAKKQLATKVVSIFHGDSEGAAMRGQFEAVFAKGQLPDEVPEFKFTRNEQLIAILVDAKMLPSKSEGRRLIAQGGASLMDGDKITDVEIRLDESYAGKVLKIGKRKFLKLV